MIEELRLQYAVPVLCDLLEVSRSGYHRWKQTPVSRRRQEEGRREVEIIAAHKRTRETYSAERLQTDLAAHGVCAGVHRIRRIRKKLGLRCKQKKKFKATTDSRHNLPVAENLLDQKFEVTRPNQVWVSDITYVPTDEGWLYLAAHKDLFNGAIVGYAMGKRMSKALVLQSLFRSVATRRPEKGLIHHSDRGSQYCSRRYGKALKLFGMQVSMSRKGNCYDNAPMESFWGTLKNEMVHHKRYATRAEAMQEIREYIEIFYNRQRCQKRLGNLSPAAFAKRYYEQQQAA